MSNIGEFIKKLRKEKGLSQLDLSLKVGWENPSTLSRIEKGNVVPNRNTIIKLGQGLNLDEENINILLNAVGYYPFEPDIDNHYLHELFNSVKEDMESLKYPVIIQFYTGEVFYWNPFAEYFFTGTKGSKDVKEKFYGTTMIDMIFNPFYGIRKNIINWDEFSLIVTENMYKMILLMSSDETFMKSISRWSKEYIDFRKNIDELKSKKNIKHTVYNLPFVYNHPKLGIIKFSITTSFLYSDKRFVVQQIAPASYEDNIKLEKL